MNRPLEGAADTPDRNTPLPQAGEHDLETDMPPKENEAFSRLEQRLAPFLNDEGKILMPKRVADGWIITTAGRAGTDWHVGWCNTHPRHLPYLKKEKYFVWDNIGSGGFADVYSAFDTELKRFVAIKVINLKRIPGQEQINRQRAERESQYAALVGSHPNIVTVHEKWPIGPGESNDDQWMRESANFGQYFIVMELVTDPKLESVGRLPFDAAIDAVLSAANGLHHAHEMGIIHRDVKPGNMFYNPRSRSVKIFDFGFALNTRRKDEFSQLWDFDKTCTTEEDTLGTVSYMAPEQARNPHTVKHTVDVYGLGWTLYKLITGKIPFEDLKGQSIIPIITAHKRPERPPLITEEIRREVPREAWQRCEKLWLSMVNPNPLNRPEGSNPQKTMEAVIEELTAIRRLLQA